MASAAEWLEGQGYDVAGKQGRGGLEEGAARRHLNSKGFEWVLLRMSVMSCSMGRSRGSMCYVLVDRGE